METTVMRWQDEIAEAELKQAAEVLKKGGLVAFPTETVYGLGGNALNEEAIEGIYRAKGRPSDNPLIVHIGDVADLQPLVREISEGAKRLMDAFWPGPLTIILPKSDAVPLKTTGGLDTVAVRMPNHPVALKLLKAAKVPVAAPSANTSGKPSPTCSAHVEEDLIGKIDVIIDGGATGIGLESTVVEVMDDGVMILRPGGVTKEDLLMHFDKVTMDPALESEDANKKPRAPGQKYKHYSPKAEVYMVREADGKDMAERIVEIYEQMTAEGKCVGIMATEEHLRSYEGLRYIVVGNRLESETVAANLFRVLRDFDAMKVDVILAEVLDEKGINLATMNRLRKAAGGKHL